MIMWPFLLFQVVQWCKVLDVLDHMSDLEMWNLFRISQAKRNKHKLTTVVAAVHFNRWDYIFRVLHQNMNGKPYQLLIWLTFRRYSTVWITGTARRFHSILFQLLFERFTKRVIWMFIAFNWFVRPFVLCFCVTVLSGVTFNIQ